MRTPSLTPFVLVAWLVGAAVPSAAQRGSASSPSGAAVEAVPVDRLWRYAVIGDYGSTGQPAFDVGDLVHALAPDVVLTVGDNNYPDGEAATIDENIGQHYHDFIHPYLGTYGPGASANRFFPALGNHDWNTPGAQPYLDYFTLPGNERYYDVRRGPVHFFLIDSDTDEPDGTGSTSVQAQWLESALADSDAPFRVVLLHHAPYSSGADHGSVTRMRWPYGAWGASLVIAGHDHVYERIFTSGLTYVVNGLGGRSIYDFGTIVGGSRFRFNDDYGAMRIEADQRLALVSFVTRAGVVVETFALQADGQGLAGTGTELLPSGSTWRYRDTGVAPGSGWTSPGYDDSRWAVGEAPLGYGEGDEATVVSYGGDPATRHATTWFRARFRVADAEAVAGLACRLVRDDAALVWINGREAGRFGLPLGAVEAGLYAPLPDPSDGAPLETSFDPRLLVDGVNTIAVELHQAGPADGDLSFDLELVAR